MIGNIHRIQKQTPSESYLISQLFLSHMAQISIIATWASGNLYHIAWQSNYSYWQSNPSRIIPIAHNIWDPNHGTYSSDVFSAGYTDVSAISCTAGLHHWLYTIGARDESDIFLSSITLALLSILLLSVSIIPTKYQSPK
jgi:photosystem I P700 chlorophyll a apoprotein A2